MAQSALIVRVAEAEPLVAHWRERFDPSARLGVPAHVTLLYPFMAPERITEADLDSLRGLGAELQSFAFRLLRPGRFPGSLYLAPEPAEPFVALTRGLCERFPAFPPYAGRHTAIVPHLTVAQAGEPQLDEVQAGVQAALNSSGGVPSRCSEFVLIENATGRWRPMHVFALAGS